MHASVRILQLQACIRHKYATRHATLLSVTIQFTDVDHGMNANNSCCLMQNFFYAATRFGGVKEVLLSTFDKESLEVCLAMGFVCFDATTLPLYKLTAMNHTAEVALYGGGPYMRVSEIGMYTLLCD